MTQVLLTDLIDDFITAIRSGAPYIEISRKFNVLSRYIGPAELSGLREAWGYFEAPQGMVYSYAFDDTFNYLVTKYKGVKVNG